MSKLMKKKGLRTFLIIVLVILAFVLFFKLKGSSVSDNSDKYAGVDFDSMSSDFQREGQYSDYVAKRTDANTPMNDVYDVPVTGFEKQETTKNVTVHNDLGPENEKEEAVLIPEGESAVYSVDVKEEGFYNLRLEYYPSTGDKDDRGIAIETKVELYNEETGKYETPFNGADGIDFGRVYTDEGKPSKDNQGNEIRPSQIEDPTRGWISSYFEDPTGYEVDPYYFYLHKGVNKIRLTGVNERLIMRKLEVGNRKKIPEYKQYKEENSGKPNEVKADYVKKIQGEKANRRSSPSLYATYDRTSGDTEYEDEEGNVTKHNTDKQVLNVIGGTQWKVAGDWLEWTTNVEAEGDYVIGIKGRQGYNRGYIANRSLLIDGEIPFQEVSQIQFTYSNTWDMLCLQDEKGEAYKFHLTAGEHKIRLKITLGELGDYLSQLSESVFRMNQFYRQILVLTGTEPDEFRDYQIEKVYPEIITAMGNESKILYHLVDEVTAYTGERGGEISVAQTLAAQMEKFVDRPDKIPQTLANYKENVSSLGTSINNLSATAMDIDYIVLAGDKAAVPEVNEGSFDKVVHECTLFINSFRSDSSALGNVYDSDDPDVIDVWITAGRDQSTILKNMVDQQFTPKSKEKYGKEIKVNVKLIDAAASANTVTNAAGAVNAMLPAVMSGNGPDVALCIAQTEPVNYALRGATVDLTKFPDYKEVLSEYQESAYESYWLTDKDGHTGLYGLPETENYNVLFYRTDIMEELGVDATQINTWDDVITLLPKLQKSNMSFAVPSVERKINNASNPDLANYYAQLVQRGGSLYRDDGIETTIGSTEGISAFEFYTKLFTNYKLVKQYDFANRFRSGEMPIGVADFSTFNTLSVFAPEIKGLWNFGMVPGVKQEDGTINRSVQCWGTASMMLRGAEERNKEDIAWSFLKWWASADTQATYARELEAVMGAAARYATANKKTFQTLSWSSKESEVLDEQHEWAFGIRQVAGGYYTERHITNAIRKVMNNNEDPRETILDYVITINKELSNKRQEFGLKTLEQEKKEKQQK